MRFNIFDIRFFIVLTAVLMAGVVFGKKKNNTKEQIDTVQTSFVRMERTPVLNFNDTLFNVYGNIGSFTSKQRAKSIQSKISMLADNYLFEGDSIKLSDTGTYLNIVYKNEILMSVDSLQAAQENKSRVEAAEYYRKQIISAVELQLHNTSWQQIFVQVAGAVGILIAEYFILKWIRYGYRRVKVAIWKQRGKKIKGIFGIIDDHRAMLTTISIAKVIKFLIVLIFLYLGLLAIFKLFPYTKHLSDQLLEYVLSPLRAVGKSVKAYMPKLFTIAVIVFIFKYIQKFIRSLAEKIATNKITIKGFYPDWAMPTYNPVSYTHLIKPGSMLSITYPY